MLVSDSAAIVAPAVVPAQDLSGPSRPESSSTQERKLTQAAGEFESILLASMWKSMKQSFGASDTEDSDPAHGTLDDWGIEVMSGAVGKAGGLGIGKLILQHLEPELRGHADNSSSRTPQVVADKTK